MSLLRLPLLGPLPDAGFPATDTALDRPNGLLAWGGDLEPERLLSAYRHGIFPWYSEGQPVLWWSPAPRCVILPAEVHLSRRTRRRYNAGQFTLTMNRAFDQVIAACAEPRSSGEGTWISQDMIDAYCELHRRGVAHSLEVWCDNELSGGIYGLGLGAVFFGESMFSRRADASKIALVALCRHLQRIGVELLDCQVGNPHLYSMGAIDMERPEFEKRLQVLTAVALPPSAWSGSFYVAERW